MAKGWGKKLAIGGICALALAGTCNDSEIKPVKEHKQEMSLEELIKEGKKLLNNVLAFCVCDTDIDLTYSREEIEKLVNLNLNPKEAFDEVRINMMFSGWSELSLGLCLDRWLSLQESFSLGEGDCEDGSIAFAALLSWNPEYKAAVIGLHYKDDPLDPKDDRIGHSITLYKENNLWGIASFNDYENGNGYVLFPPRYKSREEAITKFSKGRFHAYSVIPFTPEELKHGTMLQKKKLTLVKKPIKNLANSLK